jgi:hypothetical protein
VKVYTAHTRAHRPPLLLREGFSVAACVFGPLWLLAHRAWIAFVLTLCAYLAIGVLAPAMPALVLYVVAAWLLGLFGQDLRRWSLERSGYLEVHVVAAPDIDAALARLLDRRPDLIADAVR